MVVRRTKIEQFRNFRKKMSYFSLATSRRVTAPAYNEAARRPIALGARPLRDVSKQVLRIRHGRACPGHPRRWAANTSGYSHDLVKRHRKMAANLFRFFSWATWMAGTSPAMTALIDSVI
jgi:hypothetical protein